MEHTRWNVQTISGAAGGLTRDATVNLKIDCKADTVEEVRLKVEALPDLLAACKQAEQWLGKMIADGGHKNSVMPIHCVRTLEMVNAAIKKAEGGK